QSTSPSLRRNGRPGVCASAVARQASVADIAESSSRRSSFMRESVAPVWAVLVERDLDVDDRRAIEGLNRPDAQPNAGDLSHDDPMQSEWMGPMRRPGREYAGQRVAPIAAGMDFEDLAF